MYPESFPTSIWREGRNSGSFLYHKTCGRIGNNTYSFICVLFYISVPNEKIVLNKWIKKEKGLLSILLWYINL